MRKYLVTVLSLSLAMLLAAAPSIATAANVTTVDYLNRRVDANTAGMVVAPQGAPRLWDDTRGTIRAVTLHYDPGMQDVMGPVYEDLFAALSPDVRIQMVCPSQDAMDDFIEQWGIDIAAGGREVDIVNVGREISVWARDRRIARGWTRGVGAAPLLAAAGDSMSEEWRINELLIPVLLGMVGLSPDSESTSLILEGGNLVANGRNAFTGVNTIWENSDLGDEQWLKDVALPGVLGLPPIVLGEASGEAPWCHVDMYLTPIGEGIVLIASPALARKLYGEPEVVASDENEEEAVSCAANDDAMFDEAAAQVAAMGYQVIRLPAVVDRTGNWMITYNNVVQEQRGRRRIVYLPQYDEPVLDQYAARIYTDLGFEILPVDVSGLYVYGGAVRCVMNVTERSIPQTRPRVRSSHTVGRLVVKDISEWVNEMMPLIREDDSDCDEHPDTSGAPDNQQPLRAESRAA